ncbi:MAG TPA: hypothetical protein GXZ98_01125 [Firmicutes bacterium]|nr:hypothetical protein [Bacillota bacterium]
MTRRYRLVVLACFILGLRSGFQATLPICGDPAARAIFNYYCPNRPGLVYQWVAPAEGVKGTYQLSYRRASAPGEIVLGRVPLLCIVNFWNPVTAVGQADLEAVLRGEITNWQALGGQDCPIEVLTYTSGDLPQLPGAHRAGRRRVRSQETMVAAVQATPNALGVITWPLVTPRVKVLTIDGVNPVWTQEPLELTNYPYWNQLVLKPPETVPAPIWLPGRCWQEWRFSRELRDHFSPRKYLGGRTAFTLAAAGDMMFSRKVAATSLRQGDYRYPFFKVAPLLRRATITLANLEGPLSDQGRQLNMFRGAPEFIEGLLYAGIDLVSLANNHIMDYGTVAFLDTMERLTAHGLDYVGAGPDLATARQGRLLNLGGVQVGFLAYTEVGPGFTYTREPQHWAATAELPGVVPATIDYVKEDIAHLKQRADLVVVSFHWGKEYAHYPTAQQQILAKTAVAAGADLVLGHHPHALQGLAFEGKAIIAYSLGNFIFDQLPEATRQGLILEAACDRWGVRQLRCAPVWIEDEQPQIATGEEARRIMDLLATISQGF